MSVMKLWLAARPLLLIVMIATFALALPGTTEATSLNEIKKLTASDAEADDWFGQSVAVNGDTAIVGAQREDAGGSFAGAAYVFQRDQGGADNWGEVTKLTASDAETSDQFGYSVALSGDTAIVGARFEAAGGASAGAAYVFQRDLGGTDNWGGTKKLTASDAEANDEFGFSVAVSGDTAIVGAPFEGAAGVPGGAAYVFQRDLGGTDNWGEVKKLTASDDEAGARFGWSVAVSGGTILVGARDQSTSGSAAGAAYVFQRDLGGTDNWGETKKLLASDGEIFDLFGTSVGVSGDTAVVGARSEGSFAGAAYVFQRDLGGTDNWGETKKLIASDAEPNDFFGVSVSVSDDIAVVGAFEEDGTNGNEGAAYEFRRNQGGADNWGEVKKLTATDAGAGDNLGISVAVSGGTALSGALFEDAGGDDAGAAYVFDLLLPKPTATPGPTATRGPKPVGGIALDADLRPLALETGGPSGSTWGIALAIVAAVSLIAVGGAVVYVRRRAGGLGGT